jgi:hypothetical protein
MLSSHAKSAMVMDILGVLHVQAQAATNASPARVEVMMNVVGVMVLAGMMESLAFHVMVLVAKSVSVVAGEVTTTALRVVATVE